MIQRDEVLSRLMFGIRRPSRNNIKPNEEHCERSAIVETNIKVYKHGQLSSAPKPLKHFSDIRNLSPSTLEMLTSAFNSGGPTPIQSQAIPIIQGGFDAIFVAPTGSGKTLAFILGILSSLDNSNEKKCDSVKALIISPTRELAKQIRDEFIKFSDRKDKKIVYLNDKVLKSWSKEPPKKFPPHIVITTPMRLIQVKRKKLLCFSKLEHLILDEADRLLDSSFIEQIDELLTDIPLCQKSLFSATIPTNVEDLAKKSLFTSENDYYKVVVGRQNASVSAIDQKLILVGQEEGRIMAVRQLLSSGEINPPTLIFCESIDRSNELFEELGRHGLKIGIIHSQIESQKRQETVDRFKSGRLWFLICTELLARGLDMPVTSVINYDFPESTASYIHRIGRTGRAGKPGKAITFFGNGDRGNLPIVVNVMRESGLSTPDWMADIKREHKKRSKFRK